MAAPFAQYRCALSTDRCAVELTTALINPPFPYMTSNVFPTHLIFLSPEASGCYPIPGGVSSSRFKSLTKLRRQSTRVPSLVPFHARENTRPRVCCSERATWKFNRKLRECVAVLCSCWRDEIIHAASPPLSLTHTLSHSLCTRISREDRMEKAKRSHSNSAHLWRVH